MVKSNNKEGRVENVAGGQAQDFGRVFGFRTLGVLILAVFLVFSTRTAYAQGAGRALDFDGTDDRVQYGTLNPANHGTVEFWINADSVGVTRSRIMGGDDAFEATAKPSGGGYYYITHQFFHGGPDVLKSNTVLSFGEWYHIACTWDLSSNAAGIYIDGVLDVLGTQADDDPGADVFTIGTRTGKEGVAEYFDGKLDEVRIWNVVLNETTIRDWMCRKVTSNHPNWNDMLAYWKLDESSVSGQAADSKGSNSGTYYGNMTDGDCVWSGAAIGDTSTYTTSSATISITSPNSRGEATVTNIGGSPGIVQLYRVDNSSYATWPSAGPGVPGGRHHFDPLSYWGVFMSGGTSPDFDFQLDFTNHDGVTSGQEGDIDLYRRSDGSSTTLTLADDTPDGNDVVEDVNQTATQQQYILTDLEGDNSLPVELSTFTATSSDGKVTLHWRTESEVENLGFYIYRSENKDGPFVRVNASMIPGAGNSAIYHEYQFTDKHAQAGRRYFYYIEDVDISGMKDRSKIIEIFVPIVLPKKLPKDFALFQNFPNPFNPETWIPYQLADVAPVEIRIYDTKGRLAQRLSLGKKGAGFYKTKETAAYWDGRDNRGQPVASGIYFYQIKAGDFMKTRKMVIVK